MIGVLLCFLILAFASVSDLRKRHIDLIYPLLMSSLGIALLIWEFLQTGDAGLISGLLLSVLATSLIALPLAHIGFMGRGDAEMLIGISFLVPEFQAPFTIFPVFALGVFTNAIFLAALLPLLFFVRNLGHLIKERDLRELPILFLGYRKRPSEIRWYEAVMKEGNTYRLFLNVKKAKLGDRRGGKGEIWVTPALPFILFLSLGFLISVSYGDIAAAILHLFSLF